MKREPESDAVFQALVDIGKNLGETISSLNEQIRRAQLQTAEQAFQHQESLLAECLDGIDDQLIKLSVYIEEYQRLRGGLKDLGENTIPGLGGTRHAPRDVVVADTFMAILAERIDYLKTQGKI